MANKLLMPYQVGMSISHMSVQQYKEKNLWTENRSPHFQWSEKKAGQVAVNVNFI